MFALEFGIYISVISVPVSLRWVLPPPIFFNGIRSFPMHPNLTNVRQLIMHTETDTEANAENKYRTYITLTDSSLKTTVFIQCFSFPLGFGICGFSCIVISNNYCQHCNPFVCFYLSFSSPSSTPSGLKK